MTRDTTILPVSVQVAHSSLGLSNFLSVGGLFVLL